MMNTKKSRTPAEIITIHTTSHTAALSGGCVGIGVGTGVSVGAAPDREGKGKVRLELLEPLPPLQP